MSDNTNSETQTAAGAEPNYIYMPLASSHIEEELGLLDYWDMLKRRKWMILLFTFITTLAAAALVMMMPATYTAEVAMVFSQATEVEESSTTERGTRDTGSSTNVSHGTPEEAIAILESRSFTNRFIEDNKLMPVLFSERWNADKNEWKTGEKVKAPTLWDAYELWDNKIRSVDSDKSGITILSVEWKDPELAAAWANELVTRLNEHLKTRAIDRAQKSMQYLYNEILKTDITELEQALYELVQEQMTIIMVANVSDEYAYTVIDPAVTPERQLWTLPKRIALIVLAGIAAILMTSFLALGLGYLDQQRKARTTD